MIQCKLFKPCVVPQYGWYSVSCLNPVAPQYGWYSVSCLSPTVVPGCVWYSVRCLSPTVVPGCVEWHDYVNRVECLSHTALRPGTRSSVFLYRGCLQVLGFTQLNTYTVYLCSWVTVYLCSRVYLSIVHLIARGLDWRHFIINYSGVKRMRQLIGRLLTRSCQWAHYREQFLQYHVAVG